MNRTTHRRTAIAAGAAVAVAVTVGIGWALAGSGGNQPGEPAAAGLAGSPPGSVASATPGPGGGPTPTPARTPATDRPAPDTPAPPRDQDPGPAGPVIEQFRVAQQPTCPGGTTQFPIEGQPVVLEWQVTGAAQVTLSVDGPGAYGSYPATGGETVSFGCAGSEGDRQQHTYLLTATADGVTVTGTLVVSAEVHERQDV